MIILHEPLKARSGPGLLVTGTVLTISIFVLDLSLPLGVAAGVPYAALVLIGLWATTTRHVVGLALLATLLTLLGYLLSSPGGIPWVVLTNRGLALFVIWSAALLVALRRRDQDAITAAFKDQEARVRERTVELGDSNRALKEAQRLARMGSWELDLETNQVTWSEEAYQLYGISPENFEPTFETALELIHPDDRQLLEAALGQAIEGGVAPDVTYRIVLPDGSIRVLIGRGEITRDKDGKALHMLGTSQDITERWQAEMALRESEQKFRTIFDNAEVGLARMRLSDGKLLEANDRVVEILGYDDREELLARFSPQHFWADPSKRDEMVATGFSNGVVRDFEIEILRKDGSHGWIRYYAKFFPDEDYLVNVVVDVTEKKRTEQELARRSETLEAVMAHVDEGISMVDANLVSVTNNQRFYELLGFPPARFPSGTPYEDYIRYNAEQGEYGPGDIEELVQQRVEQAKRFEPHRFVRTRPDGSIIEIRGNPLPKGGFVTSYTDISERRRAELALHEREAQLGAIFNHSPIIFSLKDKEGRMLRVNQALCDLVGLPEHEILGKTSHEISPPEVADIAVQSEPQVLRSNAAVERSFSVSMPGADGPRDFLQVKYPVFDETGTTIGIGMVATDITELKQTEGALRRSNALLAAVHHAQDHFISETNPLQIFAELLDEMLALTESEYGFIGQVLHTPEGRPFLKTMAVTNTAWSDKTKEFYKQNIPEGFRFENLGTLFGAVLETGQPVIANDPASDPRSGGMPAGHPPLRSFLGVPFSKDGEIYGMAGIANRSGGYDTEQLEFLQPLTTTAANLIKPVLSNLLGVAGSLPESEFVH